MKQVSEKEFESKFKDSIIAAVIFSNGIELGIFSEKIQWIVDIKTIEETFNISLNSVLTEEDRLDRVYGA